MGSKYDTTTALPLSNAYTRLFRLFDVYVGGRENLNWFTPFSEVNP